MLSFAGLLVFSSIDARGANNIIGSVRKSRAAASPAAGDEVILVRLDKGMQEEARTQTDARGTFNPQSAIS